MSVRKLNIPRSTEYIVSFAGRRMLLTEACELYGVSLDRARDRLRAGWTDVQALGLQPRERTVIMNEDPAPPENSDAADEALRIATDNKFQDAMLLAGYRQHVDRRPCTENPICVPAPVEARSSSSWTFPSAPEFP